MLLSALLAAQTFSAFAQQTNRPNPRDFSAFQLINDRNIFDPSRRPRVQNAPRSTPRPPQIVDRFSLVGTMSYSNLVLAFFDGSSSDYRRSVELNGKIAGFNIAEIRHDAVKLVQGTNAIELKVGMQMRRSEDGHWSPGEASGSYGSSSYASNNSNNGGGRSWGRNDRRSYSSGGSRQQGNQTEQEPSAPPDNGAPAPEQPGNLDPNDPVARLMLRRMQEEGTLPSAPTNPPSEQPGNPPVEQPNTGAGTSEPSDTNAAGGPPATDNNPTPLPEPPQQ